LIGFSKIIAKIIDGVPTFAGTLCREIWKEALFSQSDHSFEKHFGYEENRRAVQKT